MKRKPQRRRRPIYVESRMRVPMEQLWDATQVPAQHQRWDVRFGSITYLPEVDGEPQRFTYATTVAPGVTVGGTGELLGDRDRPDGTRWSGSSSGRPIDARSSTPVPATGAMSPPTMASGS